VCYWGSGSACLDFQHVSKIETVPFKDQLMKKCITLPFAPNVSESSLFEWSSKGVLLDVYKGGGTPGQLGNALLGAAGM